MGASSNRAGLAFVEETSWGVNPGTALKDLNYTGDSLTFNIANIVSESIRSDRQISDLIQTGADASGGFNFELQYDGFDEFIIGALFAEEWAGVGGGTVGVITAGATASGLDFDLDSTANTITFGASVTHGIVKDQSFRLSGTTADDGIHKAIAVSGNVITVSSIATTETIESTATVKGSRARNGVYRHSFFFERAHEDVSQFFQYLGMVVNTMDLDFSASSVLKGSFDFIGKESDLTQVTEGTGTNDEAASTDVMNAVSNVGSILIDGSPVASCLLQKVGLNINNNVRGLSAIGNVGFCDVSEGECAVTGALDMYFKDEIMYSRYVNSSSFGIAITVTSNDGDTYIFTMPNCKIQSDTINNPGKNQDVMENASYQAIMGSEGYTVQVDKIPA